MSGKNVAASVRARLMNEAKRTRTDYNQLLVRYAIERLLYRLSVSPHRESFVLKGAMLFAVWEGSAHRPTQDVDFLGFGDPSAERLTGVFRDLCGVAAPEDGIVFDPASVRAEEIRTTDDYGGTRLTVGCGMGGAKLRVQVDVGFGDAVTPAATDALYPRLLPDFAQPNLRVYPKETVVAEKLEAIVKLGLLNTRLKDYFDLHYLSRTFEFDGPTLVRAIAATFERRGTPLPAHLPVALTDAFAEDPAKKIQWSAFRRRLGGMPAEPLAQVIAALAAFLEAPVIAANSKAGLGMRWTAGGPWAP
jgi:predicted nucleotidyltransferase component of viral defense system